MNKQNYNFAALSILDNWENEKKLRNRIEYRKNIHSALKKYNELIQKKKGELIKYSNIQTKIEDNLNNKIEKRNNIIQILFTDLNTLIDYVKKSFNSN